MTPRKVIEIILEIEGDINIDSQELATELESTAEILCPSAYRVNAFVVRDEELEV